MPGVVIALLLAGSPADPGTVAAPTLPILTATAAPVAAAPALPTSSQVSTLSALASASTPDQTPQAAPELAQADAASSADAEGEELVVTGHNRAPREDPLEKINLQSYLATQAVDKALVRPVAMTYSKVVPHPVQNGLRNFINNLREPIAFLNFLLQLKPGKAFETAGRFAINSTVGVGGLFDMAKRKPINLPRRPNGLANTLAFYGVKSGAFLYLPLLGPTTVRDAIGDTLDRLLMPLGVGAPFNRPAYAMSMGTAHSLDQRAEFDEKLTALHQDPDAYGATRRNYLASREAAIDALHGKHRTQSQLATIVASDADKADAAKASAREAQIMSSAQP